MILNKLTSFWLGLFLAACFAYPQNTAAQYFGKNRVQYEDFNFKVLHTEHFNIYHYPAEAKAIKDFGRLSERWYARYAETLNHVIEAKNPLIIYANHADFQQNDIVPRVTVGTGGVTEGRRNRVVMPFAEANTSTNHVLGHELVHAFQYDIARQDKIGGIRATSKLPLWFIEGMAEYLSIGPRSTQTAMYLRDAVFYDDVPSIKDLSRGGDYFPYRYGHSLLAFIGGTWGDELIDDLYRASAKNGIKKGFKQVLKLPVDSVSTLWQQSVKERYSNDVKINVAPDSIGTLVRGGEDALNVAPELSPNGKYVAFISAENLFSLELYLADAKTGDIIRKLTSTLTSPHLNALRFIESSGSWSPDGEHFAVSVFTKGDNHLAIIDVSNGEMIRNIGFDKVGALTNPAWSPDGDKIAFTGSSGGYSDLYIYNLNTDSLRNVTEDPYSDMQPVWSPDGSTIAFVSDRGPDTSFEQMTFGNMKIVLYDVETGRKGIVPQFNDAKHINPQFSPDGQSLYYISDYDGISNVYRYDFQADERHKVTEINTGISGISEFSPALTVAKNSGDVIVSGFKKSNYNLYRISREDAMRSRLVGPDKINNSSWLPPVNVPGDRLVLSYLTRPMLDLPSEASFTESDYTPVLSLDYISGGAGISAGNYGASRLGVGAAGGVTFGFSDLLNQHKLYANILLQGRIKDIGGQVGYLNTDHRFTFGGSISHRTFRTTRAGIQDSTISENGEEARVLQLNRVVQRVFQEQASFLGYYPFSTTQRFETSLNYTRIGYDFELERSILTPTGRVIDRFEEELDTPSPLNMVSTTAAYVEDNSIFGFTGPIMGHRLRFEAEPTTGSLSFLSATADYRRYFYAQPVTFAFRALHSARYFGDAESNRLTPNFIGYESLVRGYNSNSFSRNECTITPAGNCAEFERLVGSKIGVMNFELRLPILGAEELALFRTRTIPTTFVPFFDAGVAWTSDDLPTLKWATRSTERIPVFSAGASLRVNILGYLVTEFYYAFPFQRPETTGTFGFQISPGW